MTQQEDKTPEQDALTDDARDTIPNDLGPHARQKTTKHWLGIVAGAGLLCGIAGGVLGAAFGGDVIIADDVASLQQAIRTEPSTAAEDVASRNAVWRVLNGQTDQVKDGPEKQCGLILSMLLSPNSDAEARQTAMGAFFQKSGTYFTSEQRDAIANGLVQGPSAKTAAILTALVAADAQGSRLWLQVMTDTGRLATHIAGKPIPLEKLPDGSTP